MDAWDGYRHPNYPNVDESIILYDVWSGKVFGGSAPNRTVKQVQRDSDGYYPGGDFTMELDLLNWSLVMEVDNEKIILDGKLGDFEYLPIVVFTNYPSYIMSPSYKYL